MLNTNLPKVHAGFTLVELMVTLVILGILLAIAMPAMAGFIASQKVKTASFDLYSSFLLAQSEAIKRNASVTMAPVSSSSGWISGWTITAPDPAGGSTALTLLRQEALSGITISGSTAAVVYNLTGRTTGGSITLTIDASGSSSVTGRCLSIKASGVPFTTLKPSGGC